MVEFVKFPKIPRIKNNDITITEKMDGTNACIIIEQDQVVGVQSRNRMITPEDDNMGFAGWVDRNKEELAKLGHGYHYGEWAGPGIQRNPHQLDEKTFFLFNTFRPADTLPDIVKQVPILYVGPYSDKEIESAMTNLWDSAMSDGYQPEGIIIYFHTTKSYMKHTFLNPDGKWKAA